MGDHGRQRRIHPELVAWGAQMRQQDRRNPHQRTVAGAVDTAVVPGQAPLLVVHQEPLHRITDAENLLPCEPARQLFGQQFAICIQLFQQPKRQLAVVRG